MATFTKLLLSGSTNGKQIQVSGTNAGGAVTCHAYSGAGIDEVWIYACNTSGVSVTLTILWGGTSEPANDIIVSIAGNAGRLLVVDGSVLNAGNVKAYASTGSVINIDGWVNNIT